MARDQAPDAPDGTREKHLLGGRNLNLATPAHKHGRKPPTSTILVRFPAIRETDLVRVEKRLKIKLPLHYRRFLLSYPSILIETKTDLGWCHESLSDRKLRFNVDELIYYNEDVR